MNRLLIGLGESRSSRPSSLNEVKEQQEKEDGRNLKRVRLYVISGM